MPLLQRRGAPRDSLSLTYVTNTLLVICFAICFPNEHCAPACTILDKRIMPQVFQAEAGMSRGERKGERQVRHSTSAFRDRVLRTTLMVSRHLREEAITATEVTV
jgi:hypothetical protein